MALSLVDRSTSVANVANDENGAIRGRKTHEKNTQKSASGAPSTAEIRWTKRGAEQTQKNRRILLPTLTNQSCSGCRRRFLVFFFVRFRPLFIRWSLFPSNRLFVPNRPDLPFLSLFFWCATRQKSTKPKEVKQWKSAELALVSDFAARLGLQNLIRKAGRANRLNRLLSTIKACQSGKVGGTKGESSRIK